MLFQDINARSTKDKDALTFVSECGYVTMWFLFFSANLENHPFHALFQALQNPGIQCCWVTVPPPVALVTRRLLLGFAQDPVGARCAARFLLYSPQAALCRDSLGWL